jgi:hypothetical protein
MGMRRDRWEARGRSRLRVDEGVLSAVVSGVDGGSRGTREAGDGGRGGGRVYRHPKSETRENPFAGLMRHADACVGRGNSTACEESRRQGVRGRLSSANSPARLFGASLRAWRKYIDRVVDREGSDVIDSDCRAVDRAEVAEDEDAEPIATATLV